MTASQKTNFSTALAMNLYNLRRGRNMVQKEVAAGINLSQQTYSLLEKGEHSFTDEIIDGICSFFEIEQDQFVTTQDRVNLYNSPNSANYNSQINTDKIVEQFLEEIKSNREERKSFMELIKTETHARNAEREQFLKLLEKN